MCFSFSFAFDCQRWKQRKTGEGCFWLCLLFTSFCSCSCSALVYLSNGPPGPNGSGTVSVRHQLDLWSFGLVRMGSRHALDGALVIYGFVRSLGHRTSCLLFAYLSANPPTHYHLYVSGPPLVWSPSLALLRRKLSYFFFSTLSCMLRPAKKIVKRHHVARD